MSDVDLDARRRQREQRRLERLRLLASGPPSPCISVCQIEEATGWCLGCGRTGDEVARWLGFNEDERLAVWGELPQRLDQLGVGVRLLPWTREQSRTLNPAHH